MQPDAGIIGNREYFGFPFGLTVFVRSCLARVIGVYSTCKSQGRSANIAADIRGLK